MISFNWENRVKQFLSAFFTVFLNNKKIQKRIHAILRLREIGISYKTFTILTKKIENKSTKNFFGVDFSEPI